jgi:type IV secretory pathway VirB10-like protein
MRVASSSSVFSLLALFALAGGLAGCPEKQDKTQQTPAAEPERAEPDDDKPEEKAKKPAAVAPAAAPPAADDKPDEKDKGGW